MNVADLMRYGYFLVNFLSDVQGITEYTRHSIIY